MVNVRLTKMQADQLVELLNAPAEMEHDGAEDIQNAVKASIAEDNHAWQMEVLDKMADRLDMGYAYDPEKDIVKLGNDVDHLNFTGPLHLAIAYLGYQSTLQ